MTGFYLITGFLGAGKTTFLKGFVRLFPGQGIGVLVNEFGREDVDSVLLSEFRACLEEVHSGSIFCACRAEQFADALTRLLDKAPDVLVAETSGLADPTQIRQILEEHPGPRKSSTGAASVWPTPVILKRCTPRPWPAASSWRWRMWR